MSLESPATPPAAPVVTDDGYASVITAQGRKERRLQATIQPFDCTQSSVLTPNELRRMRQRHEQFVRALAGRFSIHLRTEFTMKIARLYTLSFQRLVENMRSPTHLVLFKSDPLKGVCLLEVPPRLGLLIVDRLLGGPGKPSENATELTDIEVTLLDQAVSIILTEWCAQWKDLQELRPIPLGHENNARFLQTAPDDAAMLVLSVETTVADLTEMMQVVIPVATLDTLIRKLASSAAVEKESAPAASARPRWNRQLDNVEVPVTAEWHGLQLTGREITQLKVGDVLQLSPGCSNQVQLRLAQQRKFAGQLGTRGRNWAVQVTGPISS